MNDTVVDFRNPSLISKAGISALNKELGPVGTAYFIRQFEAGAATILPNEMSYLRVSFWTK